MIIVDPSMNGGWWLCSVVLYKFVSELERSHLLSSGVGTNLLRQARHSSLPFEVYSLREIWLE